MLLWTVDSIEYRMKCGFNHIRSSQRITIERAFGQLVRTWGIMWRPISCRLARVPLLVTVLAKLHNLRVDRWILQQGKQSMSIPEQVDMTWSDPSDLEIKTRLNNMFMGDPERASTSNQLRDFFAQKIWDAGLRFDGAEDAFLGN